MGERRFLPSKRGDFWPIGMKSKRGLLVLVIAATFMLLSFSHAISDAQSEGVVYVARIEEDINLGTARYINDAISCAEDDNAPLIIKIDTLGGLLVSTKEIVDRILNSEINVVVWVTPKDAWAASAGTYILMSSDVAAMNRGTTIGAAEPRPSDNKTVQFMIGWMERLAKINGRNESAARKFVTKNRVIGPQEALKENVVELIAEDEGDIRTFLGIPEGETIIIEKGFTDQFLSFLTNPLVTLIFFIAGLMGILAEVTTGGVGVPGVSGIILLLLAFVGLRVLEVTPLGLILIALAAVLLAVEAFVPGFGVFGCGGAIALILGLFLIGEEPWVEVAGIVAKGASIALAGFFAFLIWKVRGAKKGEIKTGMESMIGSVGRATKDIDPDGVVKVEGELWAATSEEKIKEGEEIRVKNIVERKGLTTLVVEKRKRS